MMKRSWLWAILLLIPAAFYILGIAQGNPRPAYSPSTEQNAWLNPETVYHPDEYFYVSIPYRMVLTHSLDPDFYQNPPVNIYTNMALFGLSGAQKLPHDMSFGARELTPFPMYVMARYMSGLYILLAGVLTYATGRIAFNRQVGWIAASIVMFSPLIVQHAHYATPNSQTVMMSTAALLLAVMILTSTRLTQRERVGVYVLAGLLVGLTMATRYNAVVVGIVTGLAMLTDWKQRRNGWLLGIGLGAIPVGLAIGLPGIIFNLSKVMDDIRFIMNMYREQGGGSGFSTDRGLSAFYYHWRYVVLIVVGPGVSAAALAGLGLTLRRWRSEHWREAWLGAMLAIYMLVYTALALPGIRLQANLLFPLVVPLALLAGYAIARLWAWRNQACGWIVASLIVLLAWPILVSGLFVYRVDTLDNRLKAQEWIYANIPRGTRMLLLGAYNVPIDPLDYKTNQTFKHQVQPQQLQDTTVPILVYSDAGPFVTLRDPSLSPDTFVALEEGVRDLLETEWIELARFDRMYWPGENLPPDDVSYWHQMEIVIYCNPANCPLEQE